MHEDVEDQSLEALEERMEKKWSTEDDDEEVALGELIEAMVSPERVGGPSIPNAVSESEFICTSCQLIRPRASMVDGEPSICSECAGRGSASSSTAKRRGRKGMLIGAMLAFVALGLVSCGDDGAEGPEPATQRVDVFFGAPDAANTDCSLVEPVSRNVPAADPLAGAIEELLAGPTADEQAEGLWSFFSPETAGMLVSARTDDGFVRVDFRDFSGIIPNASSSSGSASLLAQLDATATQFPDIESAIYSFDGDEADFYEWLQMDVPT